MQSWGARRARTRRATAVLVAASTTLFGLGFLPNARGDHDAAGPRVEPEFVPGTANRTCASFAGVGQEWNELKVDPNADGEYPDDDGILEVTISNTENDKTFDWSANVGVDAVFVKAGSGGSNLYRYDPLMESMHDDGLTSPGASGNGISHISFCYDEDLITLPPDETTEPPNETTAPPNETTAPPNETTTPPNETTTPPDETTVTTGSATTETVLGRVVTRTPDAPSLPRTGYDDRFVLPALALLLLAAALRLTARRASARD